MLIKLTMNQIQQILFIIGISFILPFIFCYKTFDPILNIRFFSLSLLNFFLIFIYLFQFIQNKINNSIYNLEIFSLLLVLFLFSLYSLRLTINQYEGIYEILKYSNLIILLFISSQMFLNKKFYDIFFKSMVICAFILSFIGIIQL